MNKFLALGFLSALSLGLTPAAAAEGGFTVSGCVPGITDSVRVEIINVEREDPVKVADTVSTDGNFTLNGSVKMPQLCKLRVLKRANDGKLRSIGSFRLMMENVPYEIVFNQTLDSLRSAYIPELLVSVKGGDAQRQFDEFMNVCGAAEREAMVASYLSAKKFFDTNNNPDTMKIYDGIKELRENDFLKTKADFIKAHPDYHISSVMAQEQLLRTFVYDEPSLMAMAEEVMVCPDTARVAQTRRILDWSRKYAMLRPYSDLEALNVDGTTARLSSFVTPGKYTFIDFWASWCGPCRAAIPHVKEMKAKYGDKMNIVSISGDSTDAPWKKALEKEQMSWPQLRMNETQLADAAKLYFLSSIPRLILLDPEGRIVVSTNLPAEVDEYLSGVEI